MLYLAFIMLVPVLWGICISLTNMRVGAESSFVGLRNYSALLRKPDFRNAAVNTLLYTFFSIVGKAVLGVGMALLLNLEFKGRNLVRALMIIPWTLPNLVASLNWKWIFSSQGGMLNGFLMEMGLISENINFLGVPSLAFMAIVVVNVWRGTPFFCISLLARMQSIPEELYEAASIDGAGRVQRFRHITMPMIRDVLILTTLISTIWTINDFETVWLLTGGGPNKATELISILSYRTAMKQFRLGEGAASALIFAPVLMVLIFIISRQTNKEKQEA
ncbi:MAG TPA: sugar ABC transporter permease [Lachnospiraceae bacterium]|nr:sugar ABC transporter permease [Lachnospiraceae bacterium]